jgi:hypothetical protein
MSREQQMDTGVVLIIAIILLVVVVGQLSAYFENRKQKKLSQWMHEEKRGFFYAVYFSDFLVIFPLLVLAFLL